MRLGMMRSSGIRQYLLLGSCIFVLGVFLLWPVGLTVVGGFLETGPDGEVSLTTAHLMDVLEDKPLREGLINSVKIAVVVTVLSMLIAVPLAILAGGYTFRGKGLVTALVLVPLILPPFVGAIGLKQILGSYGTVNTILMDMGLVDRGEPIGFLASGFWGVVVAEALHLYPIIYLNVSAALGGIDPAMGHAAENLGASRWMRFRRVTMPLILPGVFAGGIIVFIWSLTELGTPLMFNYETVTSVQIFRSINKMASDPQPYALVAVMLVSALLLYGVGKLAFGRKGYASGVRGGTGREMIRLSGWRGFAAFSLFGMVILIAVTPHLGVVLNSFSAPGAWYQSVVPVELTGTHYEGAMGHALAAGAIRNSLVYSVAAMALDLLLGVAIAWLLVRGRAKGKGLLDAMVMMPLAVPGLVVAFGYVAMSHHWPFVELGSWFEGMGWEGAAGMTRVTGEAPNPMLFLVVAYGVRRLPYVVRAAAAGMEQTSIELEEAAMNLGASGWMRMRRVVLPLIGANLIAGGLLAFSFAMLEVSDSLILAQREEDFPITKAIYHLFERIGDGPYLASALGVWGMALLALTLVGASVMLGRRLGAVFRI